MKTKKKNSFRSHVENETGSDKKEKPLSVEESAVMGDQDDDDEQQPRLKLPFKATPKEPESTNTTPPATTTLSKRQRRKQVNNKNLWPQQPRISSSEARAKAYLRVSGLTQAPKDHIPPQDDLHSPEVRFCRFLGSPDQRVRHQAVLKLQAYLKARCDISDDTVGISELDLLRLWKGLWHTLYMADKAPVQEELSEKLASLIWCVAGTEEEDEYAGQAYMNLFGDLMDDDDDSDDVEDEDDIEEGMNDEIEEDPDEDLEGGSGSEEDDEDVVIQRVFRRFDDGSEQDMMNDDSEEDEDQEERAIIEDGSSADEDDTPTESEMHHCRGAHLASLFLRTFLVTVRREWGKMDKYRVDKIYMLVRCIMHQVYKYMSLRHWNLGIIALFNDAINDEALSKTPNGLRYHLIDLTLEELAAVQSKAPMPLTEATFIDCLDPYIALAQWGMGDDSVQKRALENILEKFLLKYSIVSDVAASKNDDDENKEAKSLVMDQVHVGTVAEFIFSIASDPETPDSYRKSLYDLHKAYMRRLKSVGRDVDLQSSLQMADDEYDEYDEHDTAMEEDLDQETPDHEQAESIQKLRKFDKQSGDRENTETNKGDGHATNETSDDNITPDNTTCKRQLFESRSDVDEGKTAEQRKRAKKKKKKKNNGEEVSTGPDRKNENSTGSTDDGRNENGKGLPRTMDQNTPKSNLADADEGSDSVQASDTGNERNLKKKKKKKKKRSSTESDIPEGERSDPKDPKGVAEMGKQKKSKSESSKSSASLANGDEEELVISVKEQKKAISAMNAAKSKANGSNDAHPKDNKTGKRTHEEQSPESSKRVKFGSVNFARSWKASMKALRSSNPSTPPAAPDQSILLNKSSTSRLKSTASTGKQRRKRAKDYF